ncbi:SpoIID/LytB domain-containing protein [Haliovirga abyssi]|uniref:Sporulation stage II protein D amidase enhancer LytB N-terminal domain-containing protein n=1 Tax=Haliovirga abyssi TaxID=2996794 RepID=A0AAU9E0V0_9FUSO|nr:SpoIID/LytB domain-containing protein [Haliovirga abyssi]BDU49980.1 hypothetical protein HLVA_05490 [Haliovirga abyssi]
MFFELIKQISKKKLILLFILIGSFNLFSQDLLTESFGKKLRVGIKRISNNVVYIKSYNGEFNIELENGKIIKKSALRLIRKNKKIYFENKSIDILKIRRSNVVTIIGIGKSEEKYHKYRGDFDFIIYKGKILPINIILAEEYLYSVVPSEIGINFPDEAIKSQIVAARTYLYYGLKNKKYEKFDLLDGTSSQMYLGYERENSKINNLINLTSHEIMVYKDKTINALYYADSGGWTANNEDVWSGGKPIPYLRAVDDKDNCKNSPRSNWSYRISKKRVSKIFGFNINKIKIIDKKNRRVKKVLIYGNKKKIISGNELRRKLGYTNVFSTVLKILDTGSYFIFKGHGSGHGVGMPQWGAYGLAKKGYDYKKILKYYYTGVKIKKIENFDKYVIIKK